MTVTVERLPADARPDLAGLPDAARLAMEAPAERWLARDPAGRPAAHVSLWPAGEARLPDGRRAGFLGHLAATGTDAMAALLDHAARRLEHRADLAVAPIDGSTWFAYRLAIDGTDAGPPFPGEPPADPLVQAALAAAGFRPVDTYATVAMPGLDSRVFDADQRSRVVARAGIRVRPLDAGRLDEELDRLHPMVLAAFAGNPLFTPLDRERFRALYRPLLARLDPRFALVAEGAPPEAGGPPEPLGLVLGYPDPALPGRFVVKTAAAAPSAQRLGLGIHLVRQLVGRAREAGFSSVLFALMHEANVSFRWAAARGRVMRRYALFARPPVPPSPDGRPAGRRE